ncbi:MAG: ammonium transporter [Bacteroidales bacterium]|jgi:Amt family ammonium transporter|nr:ammonium transporter [Bacteroidales bacterium]
MYTLDNLWVLIAGILVFFMQAGFAMVEVGFTRAKNAGNILMKNFVDFCIGSLSFFFVGFSLMYGTDIVGIIGTLDLSIVGDSVIEFEKTVPLERTGLNPFTDVWFQSVFAATAATILSGAMAGRTKFGSYILITLVLTAIIYPIQGHWTWGGGWLSKLGFHDFAGSTIVHSVGAWAGLVGAVILGPRLGKYVKGKSQAIPGHNLVLGALGVFILWLGWFGFNPGSELAFSVGEDSDSVLNVAKIFITTNLSAATGFLATLFVTWIRYKKADLSMSLNGALAGLVAITAGCNVVSPGGAIMIGLIAGVVLIFSVEFIDKVLKVDDPVGAISVHGTSGAIGTLLVGLFHTTEGLFYGGGMNQLFIQFIGVFSIMAFTIIVSYVLLKGINAIFGLRVSRVTEIEGLDIHEHGQSVYN